jgi:hypothetical protein
LFLKRKNDPMKPLFLYVAMMAATLARAGDVKYPVSAIPESLKKNANVVKRMESDEYEIISTHETRYHYTYALTILNENGEDYTGLGVWYDKFRHIADISGTLYDENGRVLKKVKAKDIQDNSASDASSLVDDSRRKVHNFYCRTYPYTIEYEVELKIDETMFAPGWQPQVGPNVSVEKSLFTVIMPKDYVVRYKSFNYNGAPVEVTEKNKKILQWKVENLPAIEWPFAGPRWHEITTSVIIGATSFQVEDYKGDMTSWTNFGKFIYELNKDRDKLPDEVVQKVNAMTASASTDVEKIQILYHFLQENTRYVGIQLGIGGWQTFDATYVAKKGYGDCKALTNYMYSLLKAANIKSYYTLVNSGVGEHDFPDDFPSSRFDHVILCIPMQKDTMWLECTSQTDPPGYMGEFTGNRKALLVGEEGGVVVSTPRYGIKENLLVRSITGKINASGALEMDIHTKYGGTQQDELSSLVDHYSKEKIKKYLQEELELATYDVNDFKYEETKSILPELNEHLNITVEGYATSTGKRLFITPNILNRWHRRIEADTARTVDIVFFSEWHDEDNYEIEIPEGYQLEAATADVNFKSRFGSYSVSSKLVGNKIIYHRKMEHYAGRFPVSSQSELVQFYADVYKADRGRMVLVKKD